MLTNLEDLPAGRTAVVAGFGAGFGLARKLDAMGVRAGKTVHKLSAQFLAGPVTVVIDGRQLAMGRGIARKVQVELKG
jgi:ferrous iron transport protein A